MEDIPWLLFSHRVMSDSFETPWTKARQAPLSMGFLSQEYWSGLPFPSPREISDHLVSERGCRMLSWERCPSESFIEWEPTPVFLPGEFHGWRSLADYSTCGWKELDMTEVT